MNKVMLYVGLAILLGTVTMVAPLALLEPSNTSPEDNNLLTTPEFVVTVPGADGTKRRRKTLWWRQKSRRRKLFRSGDNP